MKQLFGLWGEKQAHIAILVDLLVYGKTLFWDEWEYECNCDS
jgi:hypothetical protein